jgi:hypothetical protein
MKDTVPTPMAATFFMAAITKCLFRNECKGEERGKKAGEGMPLATSRVEISIYRLRLY